MLKNHQFYGSIACASISIIFSYKNKINNKLKSILWKKESNEFANVSKHSWEFAYYVSLNALELLKHKHGRTKEKKWVRNFTCWKIFTC